MSRKFASLDSLRKEEEDREGNEYYSGGNDARGGGSGLAVEGQPDHVRRLVEQASARVPAERLAGVAPTKVVLYKNGFKVNDGEFRDISVEENKKFIDTLMEGHVPPELNHCVVNGVAHMDLENKGDVDYSPPHVAYVAFGGAGSALGGPSTDGVCISPDTVQASRAPVLNEAEPSTTLQVRTHDGKKLRIKMNLSNTVANLLGAIRESGGCPPAAFTMSHGYPPQQIVSLEKSLGDTGLAGAAITIKLV